MTTDNPNALPQSVEMVRRAEREIDSLEWLARYITRTYPWVRTDLLRRRFESGIARGLHEREAT